MKGTLELGKRPCARAVIIQLAAAAATIVALLVVNWLGGNL